MENKEDFETLTAPHWQTFDGRRIPFSGLDHQHLSNIFWYYRLVMKDLLRVETLRKEFDRFNGQILQYRPHVRFEQELFDLEENGYLIWDEARFNGQIIFEGKIIGGVTRPF